MPVSKRKERLRRHGRDFLPGEPVDTAAVSPAANTEGESMKPQAVTTLHNWAAYEAVQQLLECVEPNHPETARARAELQYVAAYIEASSHILARCLAHLVACENPPAELLETMRQLDTLLAPPGEISFIAWAAQHVDSQAPEGRAAPGGK